MQKVILGLAVLGLVSASAADNRYMELVVNYQYCKGGNNFACNTYNRIEKQLIEEGFSEPKLQQAIRERQAYEASRQYTNDSVYDNLNSHNLGY